MKNTIFYGHDYSAMAMAAERFLCETFPDAFAVRASEDLRRVMLPYGAGMDDVRALAQIEFLPVELPTMVILVGNAERLPDSAQGALLTELERTDRLYVFLSKCPMIPTVESRCEVVRVEDEEFAELWQRAVGGDEFPESEEAMLRRFVTARTEENAYASLDALRMYKEKDAESFFSLYREDCWRVMRAISTVECHLSETDKSHGFDPFRVLMGVGKEHEYLRTLPTQNEFTEALMELI